MSVSQNPGLKYKHENFKALKDEIDNIKYHVNQALSGGGGSVLINDKSKYISRLHKESYLYKPTAEQKYLLNEILKHYELNMNQNAQGYNNKYLNKLTELLSKKNIPTHDYTQKRIQLFNLRINENHKSYINYLKKKGADFKMQSSMNKKINPMNLTFNMKIKDKLLEMNYINKKRIPKIKSRSKILIKNQIIKIKQLPLSNLISPTFNQYHNNILNKNENSISTARDDSFRSKSKQDIIRNIQIKKYMNRTFYNNKKFKIRNDDIIFPKNYFNLKKEEEKDKNNENELIESNLDDEMKLNEKKSKEEFLKTYNIEKYMTFLQSKYNFVEDNFNKNNEDKKFDEELKIQKMFQIKPKNQFFDKKKFDWSKTIFFKKLENDFNNKQNNSKIKIKKLMKKNHKSASMIINNIDIKKFIEKENNKIIE